MVFGERNFFAFFLVFYRSTRPMVSLLVGPLDTTGKFGSGMQLDSNRVFVLYFGITLLHCLFFSRFRVLRGGPVMAAVVCMYAWDFIRLYRHHLMSSASHTW